VDYLAPINGGCVGSIKGSVLVQDWESRIPLLMKSGNRMLSKVADEFALSYTMRLEGTEVESPKWSYAPLTTDDKEITEALKENHSVHFAAGKWVQSVYFKQAFRQACADDFMGLKSQQQDYIQANNTFKELY
jgi:hypothetical protein